MQKTRTSTLWITNNGTQIQRASQIRSTPFTGDSSDSESDGGGDGATGNVSGVGIDNLAATGGRSATNRVRGINPTIINQPPTPLLSRKRHPPCTLTEVQDGTTGAYDYSVSAFKVASPAFSPKSVTNKLAQNSPASKSLRSPLNNNTMSDQKVHPEAKKTATCAHANPNGFIPSSPYTAKTPTRCPLIAAASKKLGASCMSERIRIKSYCRLLYVVAYSIR